MIAFLARSSLMETGNNRLSFSEVMKDCFPADGFPPANPSAGKPMYRRFAERLKHLKDNREVCSVGRTKTVITIEVAN